MGAFPARGENAPYPGSLDAGQKFRILRYLFYALQTVYFRFSGRCGAGCFSGRLRRGCPDSSMFHTSEACNGKGTLTVENGVMTFHVSLASKKIVNLYPGLAADAEANKTAWLIPTVDTVTYADGTTEEVYGYDIPVEALDTDFQLALLGTKGKWYDHTVSVRNAEPKTEQAAETPADGAYTAAVVLEGGSGRATVESPSALTVAEGKMTATIVWSSPNYDYMIVDGEKYLPTNTEGNSTFEIPVAALGTPLAVTADTVAMSKPHEIEYTLTFTLE